jgi:hypothetical protein
MAKYFSFSSLTGGGVGALDAINGSILTAGDIAVGVSSTNSGSYLLDESGDAEASPEIIAPDTNAGNKRWKRKHDTTKADRAATPSAGNLAEVDADGDVVDAGIDSDIVDDLATLTGLEGTTPRVNTAEDGYTFGDAGQKNLIINGCMRVAQRGVSFTSATTPANSDDTYLLDRWILLSDGNDIVDVTQSTERPTTLFSKSIALDVETANKKFGILQILEFSDDKSYYTEGCLSFPSLQEDILRPNSIIIDYLDYGLSDIYLSGLPYYKALLSKSTISYDANEGTVISKFSVFLFPPWVM